MDDKPTPGMITQGAAVGTMSVAAAVVVVLSPLLKKVGYDLTADQVAAFIVLLTAAGHGSLAALIQRRLNKLAAEEDANNLSPSKSPSVQPPAQGVVAKTAAMLAGVFLAGSILWSCATPQTVDCAANPTSVQCAQQKTQLTLANVCNTYAQTLMALAAIKPKLSAGAVTTIDMSAAIAQPTCHGNPPPGQDPLSILDAQLAKLQALQAAHSQ